MDLWIDPAQLSTKITKISGRTQQQKQSFWTCMKTVWLAPLRQCCTDKKYFHLFWDFQWAVVISPENCQLFSLLVDWRWGLLLDSDAKSFYPCLFFPKRVANLYNVLMSQGKILHRKLSSSNMLLGSRSPVIKMRTEHGSSDSYSCALNTRP